MFVVKLTPLANLMRRSVINIALKTRTDNKICLQRKIVPIAQF